MSTISAGVTVPTALNLSGDTTGALTFQVSGTVTAATISSAGNFGIGTASPGYRLDVASSNVLGRFTSSTAFAGTLFVSSTTTGNGRFIAAEADAMTFGRYGVAEQMRIDSSGNVGIGTASPSDKLHVVASTSSGTAGIRVDGQFGSGYFGTYGNYPAMLYNSSGLKPIVHYDTNNNLLILWTNNTERARITSGGNMLLGTTSGLGEGARLDILTAENEADVTTWRYTNAAAGKYWRWAIDSNSRLYCLNQSVAGVYIDDGSTSWSAYSDERAKTDLKPIEDSVNKVCQLRAVTGRYKTDEEGTSRSFLIAQDVQKVFPEAVSDVNPDELGLRYSEMVPLLVAAIKEQQEQIKALQDKVAALESK